MLRYLSIFIQKQWLSPTAPHPQSPQTDAPHPMEWSANSHRFCLLQKGSASQCSIPICCDDCSTTDQTAQSLSVSRLTFPLLETERSSRPLSMAAAVIQASMPCFTQMGWRRCVCVAPCPRGRPGPSVPRVAGWSRRRARPARSAGERSRPAGPG